MGIAHPYVKDTLGCTTSVLRLACISLESPSLPTNHWTLQYRPPHPPHVPTHMVRQCYKGRGRWNCSECEFWTKMEFQYLQFVLGIISLLKVAIFWNWTRDEMEISNSKGTSPIKKMCVCVCLCAGNLGNGQKKTCFYSRCSLMLSATTQRKNRKKVDKQAKSSCLPSFLG